MNHEEQLNKEKNLLAINCYNIDYSSLTKPAQLLMDKCAEYLLSQKAEAYKKAFYQRDHVIFGNEEAKEFSINNYLKKTRLYKANKIESIESQLKLYRK